jgi:hypothetical protein
MGEDDDRVDDWTTTPETVPDGVPVPIPPDADKTPPVDHSGRLRLTPAAFANAVDLADRDAYDRGVQHGKIAGRRLGREDALEAVRALWIIFEIGVPGKTPPDWSTAEPWIRSRM